MTDNPFGDTVRGVETCHCCNLTHERVEAGGVWHCPNPLCKGPGAAYFRSRLASYRDVGHGRHAVDPMEVVREGISAMAAETDIALVDHVYASVPKWFTEKP